MSVEKLLAAIAAEADLKEKAILGEAAHNAEAVMSEARSRAAELARAIETKKKEIAARRASLDGARKRMEERSATLESFNAAAGDILEMARGMYRSFMNEPGYESFICAELERARNETGKTGEIRADAKTAAILEKNGVPNVVEDKALACGFAAVAEDGRKSVTCALEPRLSKLWRVSGWKFAARIAAAAGQNGN